MSLDGLYVGVDPGTTGAIALINCESVSAWPIPTVRIKRGKGHQNALDTPALCKLVETIASLGPVKATIEDVWLAGGDNVVSGGQLMFISGALEAAFVAHGVPVERVAPQTWKGRFGLNGFGIAETDRNKKRAILKSRSRAKAAEFYPASAHLFERVKDSDVAEATLIARFGAF